MFRAGVVARAGSRSATVNRESWFKQHLAYGQVIKKTQLPRARAEDYICYYADYLSFCSYCTRIWYGECDEGFRNERANMGVILRSAEPRINTTIIVKCRAILLWTKLMVFSLISLNVSCLAYRGQIRNHDPEELWTTGTREKNEIKTYNFFIQFI